MRWSRPQVHANGSCLHSAAWAVLFCLGVTLAVESQTINEKNTPPKPPRPPSLAGIRYGPFERNDLDLYLAKSDKPTPLVLHFHGGAFVVGNKNAIPPFLLDACAEAGITVASINYRYANQAIYPAPYLDAARALQFLRLHAGDYNLNPRAVASTGSSAGGDISLWLGFHDDLADPASDDPLKRLSTRISAVGALAAQTVFDPRVVDALLAKPGALSPAIPRLFGLTRDELESPRAIRLYEEAQSVSLLTRDDAPVFLYYSAPNKPPGPDTPTGELVHHPAFGSFLKERMDKMGVECVLHLAEDYQGRGVDPRVAMNREMIRFFQKHFPQP
jgi:hypothetical protein